MDTVMNIDLYELFYTFFVAYISSTLTRYFILRKLKKNKKKLEELKVTDDKH